MVTGTSLGVDLARRTGEVGVKQTHGAPRVGLVVRAPGETGDGPVQTPTRPPLGGPLYAVDRAESGPSRLLGDVGVVPVAPGPVTGQRRAHLRPPVRPDVDRDPVEEDGEVSDEDETVVHIVVEEGPHGVTAGDTVGVVAEGEDRRNGRGSRRPVHTSVDPGEPVVGRRTPPGVGRPPPGTRVHGEVPWKTLHVVDPGPPPGQVVVGPEGRREGRVVSEVTRLSDGRRRRSCWVLGRGDGRRHADAPAETVHDRRDSTLGRRRV